jgi:hypothetical protein
MSKHYYAVSGCANAETLHIFDSKKERDRFVESADQTHYTMDNLQPATSEQARKYCGYTKSQWDEKIRDHEYYQNH